MTSLESLRRSLRLLREADDAGDREGAFRLAMELVSDLNRSRREAGGSRGSALDDALLQRVGIELHRRGMPEEACALFDAGRGFAAGGGRPHEASLFTLLSVPSLVAALDLKEARDRLGAVLGIDPVPGSGAESLAVAGRLAVPGRAEAEQRRLRVLVLYGLGRLWAAMGRIGSAVEALRKARELAGDRSLDGLNPESLAIAEAELWIDRGRLDEAEALARRCEPSASRPARAAWQALRANVLTLRGRYSEAIALLGESDGRDADRLWQQMNVLALLNRLDEAEQIARRLRAHGEFADADLTRLLRLIQARRSTSFTELGLPPSAIEGLNRSSRVGGRAAAPVTPAAAWRSLVADDDCLSTTRTRERVRDEWNWRATEVRLLLHHGDLERAVRAFGVLEAQVEAIDSQLIATQQASLRALMAYRLEDFRAAARHARAAAEGFHDLGMAPSEWQASRVLTWALRRSGAPGDEVRDALLRGRRVMDAILETLMPVDRVSIRINKWSAIDETISEWYRELEALAAATQADPRALGRRTAELVGRVLLVRSWGDASTQAAARGADGPPGAAPESALDPDPGDDVFAIAQQQFRSGRDGMRLRPGPRRIRPSWIGDDTALLIYVVLPDRVELTLTTREHGCRRVPLPGPTSRIELRERTWAVLERLSGGRFGPSRHALPESDDSPGPSRGGVEVGPWHASAELIELGDRLGLRAVVDQLDGRYRRLAIVPDDVLVNVPFAALPAPDAPLVGRLRPFLIPEWRWVSRLERPLTGDRRGLGVGVTRSEREPDYRALPQASREVERVREAAGPGFDVLDAPQTVRRTLDRLAVAEYAHFACHGNFDPSRPFQTGLLLADGWLTLLDLGALPRPRLDLVVLASCWTANATVLPGREMIGLPMTFLRMGARSVISAIWEVFDLRSPEFMQGFYERCRQQTPIDAIAATQHAWWAEGRPPRDWAGYLAMAGGLAPGPRLARWTLRFLDSLKASTRWGFSPKALQTRLIID